MLLKSYKTEAGDVLELLYHGIKTAKVNPCTFQGQVPVEGGLATHSNSRPINAKTFKSKNV